MMGDDVARAGAPVIHFRPRDSVIRAPVVDGRLWFVAIASSAALTIALASFPARAHDAVPVEAEA